MEESENRLVPCGVPFLPLLSPRLIRLIEHFGGVRHAVIASRDDSKVSARSRQKRADVEILTELHTGHHQKRRYNASL